MSVTSQVPAGPILAFAQTGVQSTGDSRIIAALQRAALLVKLPITARQTPAGRPGSPAPTVRRARPTQHPATWPPAPTPSVQPGGADDRGSTPQSVDRTPPKTPAKPAFSAPLPSIPDAGCLGTWRGW